MFDWIRAVFGKSESPDDIVRKLHISADGPQALGDRGSYEATEAHLAIEQRRQQRKQQP